MFKIFIDGNDDRLRLEDPAGRVIGWIRGHAIGFRGLASEDDALRAAIDAWMPLETTLQRGYSGSALHPVKRANVGLVLDGAYEWIADGYRPIARLLRPGTARNQEDSFGLEFLVPSYATHHVTIAVAQAIWEVVSRYIDVGAAQEAHPATPTDFPVVQSGHFAAAGS